MEPTSLRRFGLRISLHRLCTRCLLLSGHCNRALIDHFARLRYTGFAFLNCSSHLNFNANKTRGQPLRVSLSSYFSGHAFCSAPFCERSVPPGRNVKYASQVKCTGCVKCVFGTRTLHFTLFPRNNTSRCPRHLFTSPEGKLHSQTCQLVCTFLTARGIIDITFPPSGGFL